VAGESVAAFLGFLATFFVGKRGGMVEGI